MKTVKEIESRRDELEQICKGKETLYKVAVKHQVQLLNWVLGEEWRDEDHAKD